MLACHYLLHQKCPTWPTRDARRLLHILASSPHQDRKMALCLHHLIIRALSPNQARILPVRPRLLRLHPVLSPRPFPTASHGVNRVATSVGRVHSKIQTPMRRPSMSAGNQSRTSLCSTPIPTVTIGLLQQAEVPARNMGECSSHPTMHHSRALLLRARWSPRLHTVHALYPPCTSPSHHHHRLIRASACATCPPLPLCHTI